MNWALRLFKNLVGPTAVIAAGTMGAGAVATLILAGAWFRYELLWVIVLTLPLFVISVDSSSRIGAVNAGEGMLSIMRRHIHPSLAWALLLINVPVHIFVAMGQFSVMTSSFLSLLGFHPPGLDAAPSYLGLYRWLETGSSLLLAVLILWLVLSQGYDRMQKAMTALMILMFFCFLVIALRSFQDAGAILAGFVPSVPENLPVPGTETFRLSNSTIIAIVGSAIAPGALLGIPYMSSDARKGKLDLKKELHRSVVNLGLIYGAYAVFIVVAGGFALYPLAHHAQIETVHQAGQVLGAAFPESIRSLGPFIFSIGLFTAAMTTLIVAVQVINYITLDMFNKPWAFASGNRLSRRMIIGITLLVAVLAPLWSFPALLKVILLMGINVLVIPLVIAAMIYLINRRAVMGEHTASLWRNLILAACFVLSVGLIWEKAPDYAQMLSAQFGS